MAKDYFQDILPPDDAPKRPAAPQQSPTSDRTPIQINASGAPKRDDISAPVGDRSIRNIPVQRSRPGMDSREPMAGVMISPPRKGGAKWLLWLGAVASVAVLGILVLVALRSTTVQVTPRAQKITFSPSSQFTAYPSDAAASGALAYTVRTLDIEDSEVVQGQGMVHAEEKASGTITVYNDYQTTPMKLVKNTRFAAANGLIFRTPADIVIPAKKGSTPGQVTVTVVADQPGENYNVAPGKFSVPGLKTSPSYTHVYAQSTQAMAGGFVGERPGVEASALSTAVAAVRARLEAKARDSIGESKDSIVIPDLVQIQYQDETPTTEAGGGVRVHEKAHVVIPSFATEDLAVAAASSGGITDTALTIVPGTDFGAQILNASSTLGTGPLQFVLSGSATIVWKVDTNALAQALSGKTQSAFQGIVKQFQSIDKASARIEPFWSSTFPADPQSIKITVGEPKTS